MKVDGFDYILREDEKVIGLVTTKGVILSPVIRKEVLDELLANVEISIGKKYLRSGYRDELPNYRRKK